MHKKSWAVIDRPYSLGFATVGALYERPRYISCAKPRGGECSLKFSQRRDYGCGVAPAFEGGDVAGPRILPSASTAPTMRPYGRPSLNGSTVIVT